VITSLIEAADPGVVATTSPRFFGFVIGGAIPAAVAADWLTTVWDQNAGLYAAGPSAAVVEETAGRWLKELLGIPDTASYAFVTGCQMAHFVGLAAARHHLLAAAGWDVEEDGIQGAPPIRVIAGAQRHVTVDRALRYLGLGKSCITELPADDQGRTDLGRLRDILEADERPTIVCAQAGNVNSGAFDALSDVCEAAKANDAWVHVDGAFGLWAATSPRLRHLVDGVEGADSWATDAHKWLNVPYDSGLAFCAHPESHRAAMGVHASYLIHSEGATERDEMDWSPEFSRRARGFTVYAALRTLGRKGVTELIERCCSNARRFADGLKAQAGVEVLNDVVLNQVLVRFGDDDALTRNVVTRVQEEGTCWLSGSVWQGKAVMRISVSNWATSEEDVDRSVEAILRCARSAAN
jgi:glutamate/tyrosine decarboxylase-like PLP-dependent enzyme